MVFAVPKSFPRSNPCRNLLCRFFPFVNEPNFFHGSEAESLPITVRWVAF